MLRALILLFITVLQMAAHHRLGNGFTRGHWVQLEMHQQSLMKHHVGSRTQRDHGNPPLGDTESLGHKEAVVFVPTVARRVEHAEDSEFQKEPSDWPTGATPRGYMPHALQFRGGKKCTFTATQRPSKPFQQLRILHSCC